MDPATKVAREIAYGEHERHRLDIFTQDGVSGAPVLVFVHGGGFVRGSRDMEGLPFYANVGDFAARSGFVEMVELAFPGSSHPGLFGRREDLLSEWRTRLGRIGVEQDQG